MEGRRSDDRTLGHALGALVLVASVAVLATWFGSPPTHALAQVSDPEVYRQIGELQSDVESQGDLVTLVLVLVGLILSLSVAGFGFAEMRAKEAHRVVMAGEKASQDRAHEVHTKFLAGSLDTLTLVNQTLELERLASQRAASAIAEKAGAQLKELDQAARVLIARVPVDDDHAIVTDEIIRADLLSLANKIDAFESNRFMLPPEMALPPHCQFVRGVDFHLEQHFEDAFAEWEAVALSDKSDPDLRSRTWYWIGRERTNLADYGSANDAFLKALDGASEPRRFEISRIRLELRFFQGEDADVLIDDFKTLIKSAETEGTEAARNALPAIRATLGNVHHDAGRRYLERGDKDNAAAHLAAAVAIFESIPQTKWSVFGLAEALWWLGERTRAQRLFATEARDFAQREYVHRVEFRTKVLARSAEFLCCVRAPQLRHQVDHLHQDVIDHLGHVDPRMTVYSEAHRRNLHKDAFFEELRQLRREADKEPPAARPEPRDGPEVDDEPSAGRPKPPSEGL